MIIEKEFSLDEYLKSLEEKSEKTETLSWGPPVGKEFGGPDDEGWDGW